MNPLLLDRSAGTTSLNGSESEPSFRLTGWLELPEGMTTPTARKQRQLLALLLIKAGSIVPMTVIFDELWGDDVPRSGDTTTQTYIMGLRKALGDNEKLQSQKLLKTKHGGY